MSKSTLYNKKKLLEVSFGTPSGDIDPKGAWNGVAPNYIHSHDAAHMRLTINGMVKAGISQFSMIHDSFGCPAPQVSAMRQIIKDKFYDVHEDCWLVQTKLNVAQQLGWELDDERLPDIPTLGDFNITNVYGAEYLFG
jgi:DNA-directed RNA polymerase